VVIALYISGSFFKKFLLVVILLQYGLSLFKLSCCLKGLGHQKDIFVWRPIRINQYFLYIWACLVKEKNK
jgi:hypothetical protein